VLHVRSGVIPLEPPGPLAQACVDASRAAIALVPDEARLGSYSRGGLHEFPLAHNETHYVRAYAKIRAGSRF
jgi:hypothetical protein